MKKKEPMERDRIVTGCLEPEINKPCLEMRPRTLA